VVAYLSSMMRVETRRSLVVPGWRDHWRRR
jgi:hypothetical protein